MDSINLHKLVLSIESTGFNSRDIIKKDQDLKDLFIKTCLNNPDWIHHHQSVFIYGIHLIDLEPVEVSKKIKKLTHEDLESPIFMRGIQRVWNQIVGPEITHETICEAIRRYKYLDLVKLFNQADLAKLNFSKLNHVMYYVLRKDILILALKYCSIFVRIRILEECVYLFNGIDLKYLLEFCDKDEALIRKFMRSNPAVMRENIQNLTDPETLQFILNLCNEEDLAIFTNFYAGQTNPICSHIYKKQSQIVHCWIDKYKSYDKLLKKLLSSDNGSRPQNIPLLIFAFRNDLESLKILLESLPQLLLETLLKEAKKGKNSNDPPSIEYESFLTYYQLSSLKIP